MATRRACHTATRLASGQVLIAGGGAPGPPATRRAELFDPATLRTRPAADLGVARLSHTATLLPNGKVLVVGGLGDAASTTAELYDPRADRFEPTGAPRVARCDHAAVLLDDGRVLVLGGDVSGVGATPTAAAEIYDPRTGRFTFTGSLRVPRHKHAGALLSDGRVLVIGGTTGPHDAVALRDVERYDPRTGRFTPAPPILSPRYKIQAVTLADGSVLVTGGSPDDLAELYDPPRDRFLPVGGGAGALRFFATASLLSDGSVLIAGGYGGRGSEPSLWRYSTR
jgi:hypothetical protein